MENTGNHGDIAFNNDRHIKAVFFDMDSTLIEFPGGVEASVMRNVYNMTMNGEGFDEQRYALYHRAFWNATVGVWAAMHGGAINGDEARLQRIIKANAAVGIQDQNLAQEMLRYWDYLAINKPVFMPGAVALLKELRVCFKLSMITDGYTTLQRGKINRLGIADYINSIYVSEEVGVSKPNSGIFEKALSDAGCKSCEAVMVGDNANADIRGALGVGMAAIHLRPINKAQTTPPGAYGVSDLAQLWELLLG